MAIRSPTFIHMKTIELPPALIKGRGTPVRGMSFVTPPRLVNIGQMTEAASPSVSEARNGSRARQ